MRCMTKEILRHHGDSRSILMPAIRGGLAAEVCLPLARPRSARLQCQPVNCARRFSAGECVHDRPAYMPNSTASQSCSLVAPPRTKVVSPGAWVTNAGGGTVRLVVSGGGT